MQSERSAGKASRAFPSRLRSKLPLRHRSQRFRFIERTVEYLHVRLHCYGDSTDDDFQAKTKYSRRKNSVDGDEL